MILICCDTVVLDLFPGFTYNIAVKATNEKGSSDTQEMIVTTDPFSVPVPTIEVNEEEKSLTVSLNAADSSSSEDFCIIVEVS